MNTDQIERHLLAEALEEGDRPRLPDDVELSYDVDDWTVVQFITHDDGTIELGAEQPFTQTRGPKFDYEVYEGTVQLRARVAFEQYPLAGEWDVGVEAVGGAPPDHPPVPEDKLHERRNE